MILDAQLVSHFSTACSASLSRLFVTDKLLARDSKNGETLRSSERTFSLRLHTKVVWQRSKAEKAKSAPIGQKIIGSEHFLPED